MSGLYQVMDDGTFRPIGEPLTKREQFAAMAMQGILAQRVPHAHPNELERYRCILNACDVAVIYADHLIAALEAKP